MEIMNRNLAAAELERPVAAALPGQAGSPERAERAASPAALLAGAMFAAGIVSLVIFDRAAAPAPEAAKDATPAPLPQPLVAEPAAAPSVLVPLSAASSIVAQYEDALVPFTAFGPASSEGPLPAARPLMILAEALARAQAPEPAAAPRFAEPQAPLVERSARRRTLQPIRWLSSSLRPADLTGGELRGQTAQRVAMIAAVIAAARTGAGATQSPAQELYYRVVEQNGGFKYTKGDTNDFAGGYKVCGLRGYRCAPQPEGMLIQTPEGAKISHSYRAGRAARNAILVTLPGAAAAQDLSHCPLVFDLGGNGVRTSDQAIRYDVDGLGRNSLIHDIASDTGVLVFDADKDGVGGENGRELFGDGSDLDGNGLPDGYLDGFEALAAFVEKAEQDSVLLPGTLETGRLSEFDLKVLHRRYGFGLRRGSLGGRTVSPAEAGVREIVLSGARSVRTPNFDGQGNDVVRRQGASFVRADGSAGSYEDIFFHYRKPGLKAVAWAR